MKSLNDSYLNSFVDRNGDSAVDIRRHTVGTCQRRHRCSGLVGSNLNQRSPASSAYNKYDLPSVDKAMFVLRKLCVVTVSVVRLVMKYDQEFFI